MLSSTIPIVPSAAVPSVGSISSTASWLHGNVVQRCKRLSSTLAQAPGQRGSASKADEPKCSITMTAESRSREVGDFARPQRPCRSMFLPTARSARTFFENKHGFSATEAGIRRFHTDVHPVLKNRAGMSFARPLSTIMQNRRLAALEEEADSNPRVAKMQADYMHELVKTEPQWVVERFESGQYAVNSECARYYLEALQKTGKITSSVLETEPRTKRGFFRFRNAAAETKEKEKVQLHLSGRSVMLFFVLWAFALTLQLYFLLVVANRYSSNAPKSIMPEDNKKSVTFQDVAGVEEAKDELKQVIDFLRNPDKYQELGAKIPKGVLLVGPPGNGKTLLARAVAGEANVPFFYSSAAEFEEMFVGVGASRVRKLFSEARDHSPCIIFIDELDAVGGQRSHSPNHPYARQTLNQLLVELDGFQERSGIIVIAATNTPQVLDKALTRPGRFDTLVNVGLPDVRGRVAMLELHTKGLNLSSDVNLTTVARGTPQFTGAELKNVVNQAAIKAAMDSSKIIRQVHFDFARDKVLMGSETRSRKQSQTDLRCTAYHEAGHALVGLLSPDCDPVYKATIVPRGNILGMVQNLPDEERGMNQTKDQMKAKMAMCMGGLVGEEIAFGPNGTTGGAGSDLNTATRMAYAMITQMGMSDKVGRRVVNTGEKGVSQALLETVDDEVKAAVDEAYQHAKTVISQNQAKHKALAEALLKYETLTSDEMRDIIAGKKLNRTI
eukprot:scpid39572/ scgid14910/ Mitochondrial inner membrane i-AAA protease supercomplex subunit YME1; Protein OSD1; Tat-binding homolog 11; Yeast mitochondrial escape protein 1